MRLVRPAAEYFGDMAVVGVRANEYALAPQRKRNVDGRKRSVEVAFRGDTGTDAVDGPR